MIIKAMTFYIGCAVAWFVLMPMLVIGGGIALLAYAIFAELGTSVVGPRRRTVNPSAREIAQRMCLGA